MSMVRDKERTETRGDGGSARRQPDEPAPESAPASSGRSAPEADSRASPGSLSPDSPSPASEPPRTLADRLRMPLMIGVPLLAIAGGLYFYLSSGRYQSTDDAYVRAAQVAVSTNVSGRVSAIEVHDNQLVHRGDTLFLLDPRPFRIAVDAARARLAGARLHVQALEAVYRQRIADLGSARSSLAYAEREYARQERLLKSGITSQAQADRALLARNEAEAAVSADQQQITSALADLGGNVDLPLDQHPGVEQAQAALNRALLDLSYTVIKAPIDGIVTQVDQVQVGDYLKSATPVFALVSVRDVWVRANFKENQLAHMRAGEPAKVWIDAYSGRTFRARVASLSPGTGSDFSLLPPENATGNWVKVVQRVPVRVELVGDVPPRLASGMSATVEVDTGFRRSLFGRGTTADSPATADAPSGGSASR
jgi:membrane fusion protein, multidrug efflux system